MVPEGVTILTEADHGLATVEMPKDQIAEADAAAADLAEDAATDTDVPSAEGGDTEASEAEASEDAAGTESEDKQES